MPRISSGGFAFACIVGWFALCALAIWPTADVPIIDDWTYAWSVKHLLETGRLEILSISSVYPITQILWGALFSLPWGFSFIALRVSTVVLAAIGSWAFYRLLCELGMARSRALLGTFCIACNPVSIVLTHSFMTDVPFVSVSSCAMYAYARGLMRRDARWLWLAGLACVAAVLIRQVAIAIPLAAAATLLCTRDRALHKLAGPPVVLCCAVAMSAWVVCGWLFGPNAQQLERLDRLQYLSRVGVSGYLQLTLEMLLVLAWMLLPLALAYLSGPRRLLLASLVAGACFVAIWPLLSYFDPLDPDRATLSLYELGGARNLIAGEPEPAAYWSWIVRVAVASSFMSLGALLVGVAPAVRGIQSSPPSFGGASTALKFCALVGVLHVALISVLWLYADRYYLALLPALVACVLGAWRTSPISLPITVAVLAVQSAIAIVGTRDVLQYNELCQRSYAELVRSGVRPYDIDAGWSFNGWMLYAQRQNLPAGLDRERDVPAVTSTTRRPYLFAKSPVPGYETLHHARWTPTPWPWPNELLILRSAGEESLVAPIGLW